MSILLYSESDELALLICSLLILNTFLEPSRTKFLAWYLTVQRAAINAVGVQKMPIFP